MHNNQTFEQLNRKYGDEIDSIGKSLEKLSVLYSKCPVPESARKRFTDASLKVKSAWYSCLVNSNIDVLLLPEYLESRHNRNILIKKETDQYFKSIEYFSTLMGKPNTIVYETILVTGDMTQNAGMDLFSGHARETVTCPADIQKLFGSWNISLKDFQDPAFTIFAFFDWHAANRFSFTGKRQSLLWLNYQLWKLYGPVSYSLNLEHYFFHHWQKANSDAQNSIGNLLEFLRSETERIHHALNELYKEHIEFNNLKPYQKLVSGYLFSNGFNAGIPAHFQQQHPVMKILLKKGYVELNDFGQKPDMEKLRQLFEELFSSRMTLMVQENDERYICLNPSYREQADRLSKYRNTRETAPKFEWEEFIGQSITKPIIPKPSRAVPEIEAEPVRRRQKAFFG